MCKIIWYAYGKLSLIVSGVREMYSSDTFFSAAEDDFETIKKKKVSFRPHAVFLHRLENLDGVMFHCIAFFCFPEPAFPVLFALGSTTVT